jgi:hypothetical protein
VCRCDRHLGLRPDPDFLHDRHQPLFRERLEVLRRLPEIENVEAVVAEPGDVKLRTGGDVGFPLHFAAYPFVLIDRDLGPVHRHHDCHEPFSSA